MQDESYIRIALELAKKGRGIVEAAPLAGVVIVNQGKILGASFNGFNSDDDCFSSAIENAKKSLIGAKIYSNIEPVDRPDIAVINKIIQSGISKIITGSAHPDSAAAEKGIRRLKRNKINVVRNVLKDECDELNKFFFKFASFNIPYVTLKVASTLDGKIADQYGNSKWITSIESRTYVHELRSLYDAVLIGAQTVRADNPRLNVRLVEGRNPKRIVLDSNLSLNLKLKLFNDNCDNDLIVVTSQESKNKRKKIEELEDAGVKLIYVGVNEDGTLKLKQLLRKLAKENITSLLVEGGGRVTTSFIRKKLFDDLLIFYSPKILGNGIPMVDEIGVKTIAGARKLKVKSVEIIGEDAVVNFIKP